MYKIIFGYDTINYSNLPLGHLGWSGGGDDKNARMGNELTTLYRVNPYLLPPDSTPRLLPWGAVTTRELLVTVSQLPPITAQLVVWVGRK